MSTTRHRNSGSISTTLLKRVKDLDNEAWHRLVSLFSPFVYRWLRRCGVPQDDAEDLVQSVFLRVSRSLRTFHRRSASSSFRGWLYTITRNEARRYFGQRNHTVSLDDIQHRIAINDDHDDDPGEAAELLHRVMDMIRPDFQERTFDIFWRSEILGEDTEQIAAFYGMKRSTVREAKRRVKSRLRDECIALLGKDFWPFDSVQYPWQAGME